MAGRDKTKMRIENLDWSKADKLVRGASRERQLKAAHVIADEVRRRCPVGTISRPMYKIGRYAGQPWTKRDAGSLKKTVRVVERDEEHGYMIKGFGDVRVYAGNFYAYYAQIVEFYTPFMRPAVDATISRVKHILENG